MTRLSRRAVLLGGAAAAVTAALPLGRRRTARAGGTDAPRNLILILASGGWDTSYALDPKAPGGGVDVPAGEIQSFEGLDVLVDASRPSVTGFFERHAAITAVVRGVTLTSISHPGCMKRILTGTRADSSPDLGVIVAHERGADLPLPYLILGPTAFTGPFASSAGRVGRVNQVVGLLDPSTAYPVVGVAAPYAPDAADDAAIRAYTQARADRERAVRGATGYNQRRIDDFVGSLTRGDRLRELRAGFGERGTSLDFSGQVTLALDAIATGISYTAMLSTGLDWDTHNGNDDQGGHHESLFGRLTGLADELAARPGQASGQTMLDETVVAVVSELGRTPRLNNAGGKDHWPVTSALLFGAGVAGGRAYGASTAAAEAEPIDFTTGEASSTGQVLEARHLAAGILSLCGVDPAPHLPDTEVFDAFVA